jgi:hypothetical protein
VCVWGGGVAHKKMKLFIIQRARWPTCIANPYIETKSTKQFLYISLILYFSTRTEVRSSESRTFTMISTHRLESNNIARFAELVPFHFFNSLAERSIALAPMLYHTTWIIKSQLFRLGGKAGIV